LKQVLKLTTLPLPQSPPPPNHVLIQVHYAGVQYPDALQAMGLYQIKPPLPYVPGMDVSGIVVEVGSLVTHLKPGDRVLATLLQQGGTGGMAQYVVAPSEWVYHVPDRIPHLSQVANIGRNYFAAYHSLKTIGNVGPSSLVLVDGASGGVGMATIQLAIAMKCTVIAGVSSTEKLDGPKQAGAQVVLTYGRTKADYQRFKQQVKQACVDLGHAQGVDLVVDMVQGDLFETALVSCVRPLGIIALVGFTAGQTPIRPGLLLIKEVNVVGSLWGRWAHQFPTAHRTNVNEILELLMDRIGTNITGTTTSSSTTKQQQRADRIYGLSNFIQAFEVFESNQGRGNTVVSLLTDDDGHEEEGGNSKVSTTTPMTRSKL
jgi:NADPH2:quinone reductase